MTDERNWPSSSDWPSDPGAYLTPEQRAVAEAMESPDLGHRRVAERLYELADEAAASGDDEREERLIMLADDVRVAALSNEYDAVQLAAASPDSDAEIARARQHFHAWVGQQAENLYLELPADVTSHDAGAEQVDVGGQVNVHHEPAGHESEQTNEPALNVAGDAVEHAEAADSARDDHDYRTAAQQQRDRGVERAIWQAYTIGRGNAEADGNDERWFDLDEIRTEVDQDRERQGLEPYSRQEVDAALKRMAHDDTYGTVHLAGEDGGWVMADRDRTASVRLGASDRHKLLIEDHPPQEDGADVANQGLAEAHDTAGDLADADPTDSEEKTSKFEVTEVADQVSSNNQVTDRQAPTHDESVAPAAEPARHTVDAASVRDEKEQGQAPNVEYAAEQVKAVTETSACAIAVARARCVVEQTRQRVESDRQASQERDDELARWHADDADRQRTDEQTIASARTVGDGQY